MFGHRHQRGVGRRGQGWRGRGWGRGSTGSRSEAGGVGGIGGGGVGGGHGVGRWGRGRLGAMMVSSVSWVKRLREPAVFQVVEIEILGAEKCERDEEKFGRG